MNQILSLKKFITDDSSLSDRLKKVTEEVERIKGGLSSAAEEYNQKYKKEIEEGTLKKQLLLEEGKKKGLTEDEVLSECNEFLPATQTPIMNFLYFLMRDEYNPNWEEVYKKLYEECEHEMPAETKGELEEMFGQAIHDKENYENVEELEGMDEFIYGNCTHSTFQKIKKLKALSRSDNENEAFVAYTAAMKLCKYYGLDFDKIPCSF